MVLWGILVILVIWEYVDHSRDFKVIFLSKKIFYFTGENFQNTKNPINTEKPLK